MQRPLYTKFYVQVHDREFDIEEVIVGLLCLKLSPEDRARGIDITREIRRSGELDFWKKVNEYNEGTYKTTAIVDKKDLWKAYDVGGKEAVLRMIPLSQGKLSDDLLVHLALWGGCVDELDCEGFILYGAKIDEIIDICNKYGLSYEIRNGHNIDKTIVVRKVR